MALANQLRAQLDASWPGAARIFASIDSPIALAFIARYPGPADARGLGPGRLRSFLARHSTAAGAAPRSSLARLRGAPVAALGEAEAEARRTAVAGLVAALGQIVAEIRRLEAEIGGAVRALPDGEIFLSFFRDPKSVLTATGLLAEIGDYRGRYRDADSLAADGGVAPVAVESGRSRHAAFRWACDKRLRNHLECSPTPPATGIPGPPTSTPGPVPGGRTIRTPTARWARPGRGCSGVAGRTGSPTTPQSTAT